MGVMDSSGNLVDSYVYDPFGNLFEQNETVANPWQYASGYLDGTTGLYHFGARYYNPTLGRWTQKDTSPASQANPDSLNRYLYVNNDPVSFTDPNGRGAKQCVAAILAAIFLNVGALWALWQVAITGAGLVLDVPGIGPVLATVIIVGAFFVSLDIVIFIYNSFVAAACGLAQWDYIPLNSP